MKPKDFFFYLINAIAFLRLRRSLFNIRISDVLKKDPFTGKAKKTKQKYGHMLGMRKF